MSKVVDLDRVRRGKAELSRAVELGKARGSRPARPVPVGEITAPAGSTLTVEDLASVARLAAITIRRDIRAGKLKAANGGGKSAYRISRADAEAWWRQRGGGTLIGVPMVSEAAELPASAPTAQSQAQAILNALQSTDALKRGDATIAFAKSDATTRAIVQAAIDRHVEAHPLDDSELSDWRALDGEPFQFPEEVGNQ